MIFGGVLGWEKADKCRFFLLYRRKARVLRCPGRTRGAVLKYLANDDSSISNQDRKNIRN